MPRLCSWWIKISKNASTSRISQVSKQNDGQTSVTRRPTNDDKEAWKAYWEEQGQPWRTEPEIDAKWQAFFAERRSITPDIHTGSYPFKHKVLNRADIEWLLATHENGRGPLNWSDESQREREGMDLRGADLRQANLSGLPLARMKGGLIGEEWVKATEEQRSMAAVRLEEANLMGAQLQEADLQGAHLEGAHLEGAQLQGAHLWKAQLQKATFQGAQLQKADLRGAQLQGAGLQETQVQEADLREAQLQGTHLWKAQLQKADLRGAQLQGAILWKAQLQKADLMGAQLQEAILWGAQLQEADLREAQLQGVDLRRTDLEHASMDGVNFSDQTYGSARFADINWGEVNLAVVNWGPVTRLGDEQRARQKKDSQGRTKNKQTRVEEYKESIRANRQLAVVLRSQGLNEEADHFAYCAQLLQRVVLRWQRKYGRWLFSVFLAALTGYGYRLWRILIAYGLIVSLCAVAYYVLGLSYPPHLFWHQAFLESITAFHGRVFTELFNSNIPQMWVTAFEAIAGLVIEGVFIAMLTQRFFGK